MSKLTLIMPTENETIAENISMADAALLVSAYVAHHSITDDLDATYTDDSGVDHEFDFDTNMFAGQTITA